MHISKFTASIPVYIFNSLFRNFEYYQLFKFIELRILQLQSSATCYYAVPVTASWCYKIPIESSIYYLASIISSISISEVEMSSTFLEYNQFEECKFECPSLTYFFNPYLETYMPVQQFYGLSEYGIISEQFTGQLMFYL